MNRFAAPPESSRSDHKPSLKGAGAKLREIVRVEILRVPTRTPPS